MQSHIGQSPEADSALFPDPSIPGPASARVASLDGVRGVAILLVMLFHCALRQGAVLDGANVVMKVALAGWLGVDVFFVLSGFLITGILIDTTDTTNFFRNFYVRRILRIMPLYYLVLAIVLLILPVLYDYSTPALSKVIDRQGWLWLHLSNVGFVYFRKAWLLADWLDLSHLWSLAVEEQFYLIWPLLVWLLPAKRLPWLCMLGIILPVCFRLALWKAGQTAGAMYFATPCRVDGLAMGALIAVVIRDGRIPAARVMFILAGLGTAGLFGMVVYGGGLWFADKAAIAFAPIFVNFLTAAIILRLVSGGGAIRRVLENPFLRFSGKYSYGLYLFHPLIVSPLAITMLDHAGPFRSSFATKLTFTLAVFVISFAAALLSFHGFEKHFLKFKARFHAVPS